MKTVYSNKLIWHVIDLMRVAITEIGVDQGQEKVEAMLDAFDPSLKRQVLIKLIAGQHSNTIAIRALTGNVKQKISAIKAIRIATGYGLKESKDVIDEADRGVSVISGVCLKKLFENC